MVRNGSGEMWRGVYRPTVGAVLPMRTRLPNWPNSRRWAFRKYAPA